MDEDGDYPDWVELYNNGTEPINLSGWSLTDDPNDPEKWAFPDITLQRGAYLVVFASGKDRSSSQTNPMLHTNFRINRLGEYLALYNVLDQRFVDELSPKFPRQFTDMAYGRLAHQTEFVYIATPTPGEPNDEAATWQGVVAPIEFSHKRGFYDAPLQLELTTATPKATIRYTMDGSEPTKTNGTVYTGPIEVNTTTPVRAIGFKASYLPSPSNTHTYIFLDDVLKQPATPPGFPLTWGTHNRNVLDYVRGTPVIADYEMDPDVVNDPKYKHILKDDLKSIPTLSIVTDVKNFEEIYANPQKHGRTWERPASAELIEPDNQQQGFQINAGLRIHGGVGRNEAVPKHSFRLFFRDEYGPKMLNYPLFTDSPVETFDTLVLRAGTNRSFAGRYNSQHHLTTYTRDEWTRRTQIEMSGVSPRGIFVHLYVNGLYWGLYNLVERPDAVFTSAYLGGQEDDWYVRDQDGSVSGSTNETILLLTFAVLEAGNAGFAAPDVYETVSGYIDTMQFSDYIILNWYAGNQDWPYNNWYAAMQNPSGKIQFFVWDAENTFKDGAEIRLQGAKGGPPTLEAINAMGEDVFQEEVIANPIAYIFNALMANADFRIEFIDRVYKHLFNDGSLTDENAQARWQQLSATINRAIVGESARWGDTRYETPITRQDWLKANDAVLNQIEGNADKLVALLRESGYYPPIDPPTFSKRGGLVPANFTLMMSNQSGNIYYTTDGSDPRQPVTGTVSPTAKQYTGPIPIATTTQVKSRVLANQTWSALNQATFTVVAKERQLRITEIMYNPVGGDDYEYIELKNTGKTQLNLSGLYFTGIDFTFPMNTYLDAGEFIVLVRNATAFAQRYPDVPIGGNYQGKLSNGGEQIALKDIDDEIVDSVDYDDENGWPLSADGRRDSLVLNSLDSDPNDPKSWQASIQPNGSPGADDVVQ